MVFPKARVIVSAGLFLAWIGFLAYLVARTRNPVILSRPQLNVADLVVVAEVEEKDGRPAPTLTVNKVVRSRVVEDAGLAGSKLTVPDLVDCGRPHGWDGPGAYLVLLSKRNEKYEVTAIPPSPAYPRSRPDIPPKYVTVLTKEGTENVKVAELVGKFVGDRVKNIEGAEGIMRRNVSWKEAEEFKKEMEAAHAKVMFREEESRIYRATPEALEQLR